MLRAREALRLDCRIRASTSGLMVASSILGWDLSVSGAPDDRLRTLDPAPCPCDTLSACDLALRVHDVCIACHCDGAFKPVGWRPPGGN